MNNQFNTSYYSFDMTTSNTFVCYPQTPYSLLSINDIRNERFYVGQNALNGNIKYDLLNFCFHRPFYFYIEVEDNKIFISNKELNIECCVDYYDEIKNCVLEELLFLWNEYAIEHNENLNEHAIQLKKIILDLLNIIN